MENAREAQPRCPIPLLRFFAAKECAFSFLSVHHVSSEFAWLDKIYFITLSSITFTTMARYKEYGYDIKDGVAIIPKWEMEIEEGAFEGNNFIK